MNFVDTHCHVDFYDDINLVISEARKVGVNNIIIPCIDESTLEKTIHSDLNSGVHFALGLHPRSVNDTPFTKRFLPFLESMKNDPKKIPLKAIGECGIDFYVDVQMRSANAQIRDFIAQIELAQSYDLPLLIHTRNSKNTSNAADLVAKILNQYDNSRGVIHCFDGSEVLLDLKERFCYGIGGVVTFKNATILQDSLKKIPLDRLLLETDAPYLAPTPHRGKQNAPKYIPLIAEKIANILGLSIDKIATITTQNAKTLFRI